MGSSSSSVVKPPTKKKKSVDGEGFPLDGSIKSMSSVAEPVSYEMLNSMVHHHENEIHALQERSDDFERKIQMLQKTVDQLTLNMSGNAEINSMETLDRQNTTREASANLLADSFQPIRARTGHDERNLPLIGDSVVAMWEKSKWQYFTATIVKFDRKTLKYTIEWDDHDPTGRLVDYFNLAKDVVPAVDQIGVGSKVMFPQGSYKSTVVQGVQRSGGLRWHAGEIDNVFEDEFGIKRYDGHHSKGADDGKRITYKDYCKEFTGYKIDDLRMPPNVFDILTSFDSDESEDTYEEINSTDECDVFVSYVKINCPSAIASEEIKLQDLPPSYEEAVISNMCDPRNIVLSLKAMGIRVYAKEDDGENSLLEIVNAMKKSKVFIACLSDEYASNDRCRMEFQYAKKTLKIPVIPLVVGAGSFQWQMTVVGLLIAGELYIHFKNKEVEGLKMTELARAIQNNIPGLKIKNVQHPVVGDALLPLYNDPTVSVVGKPLVSGKADFFFSYCWLNSKDAVAKKQISAFIGGDWSDPRLLVRKLSNSMQLQSWLDVERLESAADGLGMFGQIATAMNECKIVVACISNEYADSDNCRMEFQFAVKSLRKPLVAVVVGDGSAWKESVVGKLIEEGLPLINIQDVSDSHQLDARIKEIAAQMKQCIDKSSAVNEEIEEHDLEGQKPKLHFSAPVPGDHVVCLHQKWAYFMATVESFDENSLQYTVAWDDGDSTGRIQSYKDVALDVIPTEQIGIGSIVLFAQGSYGATDGNNTGGSRYHQGRITKVYTESGVSKFDGEHTKSDSDGKWITYREYEKSFVGKTRGELRLSPNAMDALMACKKVFTITQE